ncbi:MAG: hypothetical protein ACI92G_001072 [Candidatus Pelagisphaera sp.]|jgi:hypothetical protein
MKMKKIISIGAVASIFASGAFGSFGVTIDVGSLQDEVGADLVQKGMLYLVSGGVDGEFSLPEAGGILGAGSDDAIVESWDLTSEVSAGGEYIIGSGEVSFAGLVEGQSLAILWFPNLTEANQVPAASEAYGFYRSADGSGGDSWTIPTDGTLLHSLKFFAGASLLLSESDVPPFLAAAAFAAGEDAGPPVINLAGLSTGEPAPGTVTFGWNGTTAPGGAFNVERRLQGGVDWTVLGSVGGDVESFDDSDIGRGKDYEYRLVAINGFGTEMTAAQSYETLRSTLANIATRGVLGSGDQALILGFVIKGEGPIDILTRAQGPELGKLIDATTAIDPEMTLVETDWTSGSPVNIEIGSNDNWGDTQLAEIKELFDPETFAQPNSDDASLDAGMALNLDSTRLFTVVVNDKGDANGLAIVEVFDKSRQSAPNDLQNRLVNVATRGFVGAGDERLIAGFIVSGLVDSKLLLRGMGPSIGIPGTIVDPKITLFRTDFSQPGFPQVEVGVNDNWEDAANSDEVVTVSQEVGAAVLETGSKDAILLVDAVPGLYSFVMEGVGETTGIGLVEVFLAD